MEASEENVEVTDVDSVSIVSDKSEENDKISKITSLDDTIAMDEHQTPSKNISLESSVLVNNGDDNDTDAGHEKNTSNDLGNSDTIQTDHSNKSVNAEDNADVDEECTNHLEITEIKTDSSEQVACVDLNPSLDDENLLDEIHRGDFKTSSPNHDERSDNFIENVDDSEELLEIGGHRHDDEQDDEEDQSLEEEQSFEEENSVDENEPVAETIEIDDDDDDDDIEEEDENERDLDSEDMLDESDEEISNEEENDQDIEEDEDVKSNGVSDDSDVELVDKESDVNKHCLPKGKPLNLRFRDRMKNRAIRCLTLPKRRQMMLLEQSSNTKKIINEHSNGNNCQSFPILGGRQIVSTEKTKETAEMVHLLPNENDVEMEDSNDVDDVCVIEDSPVKYNGKCEKDDDRMVIEQNIKAEQIDETDVKQHEIINENIVKEKEPENNVLEKVILSEVIQANGDDLASNKSNSKPMECSAYISDDVPKSTDLSFAERVPTTQDVLEEVAKEVPVEVAAEASAEVPAEVIVNETKPNKKRSRSTSPIEDVPPTKRLRKELEQSYAGHNKLLQDYIETTSNNSADEIKNHVDSLLRDVQKLQDLATAKEQEWNAILHLKKVKEEIIHRLTRKKDIMEIMSTKVGEVEDYTILEQQPSLSQKITKENRNSLILSDGSSNSVQTLTNVGTETAKSILNRAAMNTSDLAKEKAAAAKMHRNILPKPENSGQPSPNIVNYMASIGATNFQHIQQQQKAQQQLIEHQQQQQQLLQQNLQQKNALTELLNGHHQTQIGRQGPVKDVKSIIEDFRQKNPDTIPRRGRRLKGLSSDGIVSSSRNPLNADGIQSRQSVESRMSELGLLLTKMDGSSRPSSADSSPGNSNLATNNNISTPNANVSFNDMLIQYAKMNNERLSGPSEHLTSTPIIKQQPGYPEVTLHPVNSQANTAVHPSDSPQSNSLLHGILTKNTRPSSGYNSFSPTLARLLTAPERITNLPNNYRLPSSQATHLPSKSGGINLTKPRSEITITPVMSASSNIHQTILQHQIQRHHDNRMKLAMIDDEADDSADRLVIDEGDMHNEQNVATGGREFHENEVPECQGCKKREAQFVCAGCGNQWYCSRICQVSAWDEHSEVCTG